MTSLQYRQEKIQAKRKDTPWREFVRDICSWRPVTFYKQVGGISKYPQSSRIGTLVDASIFENTPTYSCDKEVGSFFDTLAHLLQHQALPRTIVFAGCENATYSDQTFSSRNVYLSNVVIKNCENILYSFTVRAGSSDVLNSLSVNNSCSVIYSSRCVSQSSFIFYSSTISNSTNCRFCTDMTGCQECLFCDGLENKAYCIRNTSYSKEEYMSQKAVFLANKELYEEYYMSILAKPLRNHASADAVGGALFFCNRVDQAWFSENMQDAHNVVLGGFEDQASNICDCLAVGGVGASNNYYGVMGTGGGEHVYCSVNVPLCSFVYYSYFLESCSFCLGCVGLKNSSYCIFNKQYGKEERTDKVNEILSIMDEQGVLGDFFPASMNPFYFNDTAAYLIDPSFTKEEVTKLGYLWRDEPIKVDIPEGAIIVKSSELGVFEGWIDPSNSLAKGEQIPHNSPLHSLHETLIKGDEAKNQWKLDETVCKRVIIDDNGDAYRIIPMELEFLQKHGLPLPRKHWLTRMKENFRIN